MNWSIHNVSTKAPKHLNHDRSKIAEQATKDTQEYTTPSQAHRGEKALPKDTLPETLAPKNSDVPETENQKNKTKLAKQAKILYFRGASNILSNFAPCKLKYQGKTFSSVEQAYFYHLLTEHGVLSFVLFNDAWSQKGHSASNTTVILA